MRRASAVSWDGLEGGFPWCAFGGGPARFALLTVTARVVWASAEAAHERGHGVIVGRRKSRHEKMRKAESFVVERVVDRPKRLGPFGRRPFNGFAKGSLVICSYRVVTALRGRVLGLARPS